MARNSPRGTATSAIWKTTYRAVETTFAPILSRKLPDEGLMFIGNKGTLLCGFTGENPVLIPESRMKAFQPPPKTLPRSPGNEREWLDACKGGKVVPGANFEFSDLVTETILLGNVALRTGERLAWDRAALKAANAAAAQGLVRPEYRKGWTL